MKIMSFPTIDQCVDYLVNIGLKWNYERELDLHKKGSITFKGITVFYDPRGLLDTKQ